MDKIIKGYWKCQYCGTKDIDGLADVCPNCGKRKPENTKYYLKDIKEELTDAELEEAGISRAECDGKHKDWVCSYCNQLNNWSDETCAACSTPKTESEFEYGMRKRKAEDSGKDTTDLSETADIEEEDSVRWQDTGNDDNDFSSDHVNADTKHGFDWKKKLVAALGGCIPLFALLAFLFWPVKEEIRVSGFSWARNITVEEEKTFDESGWSVPTDGRVYDETVVLLSKLNAKQHIEVELNLDELDLTAAESKATYEEIKAYVLEHTGLKVSHLYIAQVKQKYGIIERENYNKPKSENAKQPKCPPEKEAAIMDALKHFHMV